MRKNEADKIIASINEAKETMERLDFCAFCVQILKANNDLSEEQNDWEMQRVWNFANDALGKELVQV